jgi:iron-sulfur cluster repair protein YtfE (RIC family)
MKATDLLEKQHAKVKAIFAKLEGREDGRDELVTELANDLAAHMTIEQELFYPAVREVDTELVAESFEEHALAELALRRLLVSPSDAAFKARVTALKELIEHHVKEEEEELFPKVEKALEEGKLLQLGEQMEARFDEVVEAGFKSVVSRGVVTTSADTSQKPKKAKPRAKKAQHSRRKSAA